MGKHLMFPCSNLRRGIIEEKWEFADSYIGTFGNMMRVDSSLFFLKFFFVILSIILEEREEKNEEKEERDGEGCLFVYIRLFLLDDLI
jgi:hypothetical protein